MENLFRLDDSVLKAVGHTRSPFDSGLPDGVKWFINNAMALKDLYLPANASLQTFGTAGPGLNMRDFGQKVIVPLLKITIGRYLTKAQAGNLGAFLRLVSDTFRPASLPQAQAEFHMLFELTEQRVAQTGNLQTVGGGSTTTTYDIIVSLERKIVSTEIDTMELFYTNDPALISESIIRELESMQTALDLSVLLEHAKFCARQPLLGEMCGLKEAARQNDLTDGAIIQACQLENIVCGSLNRNPKNMLSLLHTGLKILDLPPKDGVVVTTNTVFQNSSLDRHLSESHVSGSDEMYIYNVNGAAGMPTIATFGRTIPPDAALRARNAPLPLITTETARSKYGGLKNVDNVLAVHLGNNEAIPIIPLDSTKFSMYGNTSVETTMTQECIKRLFFTVGTCPKIYDSIAPGSFYGPTPGGDEITPAMVALRSPSSTYIMDMDRGDRVQEITLRDLHRTFYADNKQAFDIAAFARKFAKLVDPLETFDEVETARLFLEPEWERKMASQHSIFEFDPRMMLIVAPTTGVTGKLTLVADGRTSGETLAAMPRVCMYNSSPLSMKQNETVGVLSSLVQTVGQNKEMLTYCQLVRTALADTDRTGVADVMTLRKIKLSDTVSLDKKVVARLVHRGGRYLPLSDPYCQLLIMKYFDDAEHIAALQGDIPLVQELTRTLREGYCAIQDIFNTMFDDEEYSLFSTGHMTNSICRTYRGTNAENLFLNVAYAAVLPIFSNTLFVEDKEQYVATDVAVEGLVIPTYKNACFVSNTLSRSGDTTELWGYVPNTHVGLTRPIWIERSKLIAKTFGTNNSYMGFLYHLHLSTMINAETILRHFDAKYYSGWSYFCVRTTRFTGHGMAILPQKAARYITGNMYAGMPVADGTAKHVWTQCVEMAVGPSGLDKLGVYIPNIFCTDINGMGVNLNPRNMYAIAIFDAYNGFTPETKTSASPITNILALSGRYKLDPLNQADPVTGLFSQCPTLITGLGAGFDRLRTLVNTLNLACDHAYTMILSAVDRGTVFDTLPVIFSNVDYMRDLEILKRTVDSVPADRNIYRETLGLVFADNYVIGKNGEHVFRSTNKMVPPTVAALSPKVLGESLYNGAIYGDMEYGFSLKLGKYTGVTTSMRIDLNAV
ncbi:ORF39 [black bullhead herpesvirus]|uniref:ORF39 n=1 Tax=black bullhead herpesvirus TaxID=508441 RepID=A0A2H5AJH4_9VIRU|nr:ORF39 [black bullhead herpesvirus]AUG72292.1 ORF39 [black bullhead herpesvirus]